jgi:invasion protein IalB
MKVRLTLVAVAIAAIVSGFTIAPAASAAQKAPKTDCSSALQAPLTGTFVDAAGNTATYDLCYTLQKFTTQNGQLTAVGNVTGTATDLVTGVTQQVKDKKVPSAGAATGTCTILDLTIQPIDLNLLGLMVHTDTIHLEITAQSGPGNLLGNLLCDVANLLNDNGSLSQIVALLNQIIDQL